MSGTVVGELRFDGRVAIVTGAGRGMAREHAKLLARRGARVVVNDVGSVTAGGGTDLCVAAAVVAEIVAEIGAEGGDAIANTDSVASAEGAQALVDAAVAAFGRLDIVINSAGIFETRSVAATDLANLAAHVTTNLLGSAAVSLAAWPHLVASGAGRIVNTQSSAGVLGLPERMSYGTSKTGIIGLTRCLARDGLPHGIRVNLVNPLARTRMWLVPGTDRQLPEVPAVPPDGEPDPYRPELASPMYAVLAHESCPTTGEMYNCGAGRASRHVLAETLGIADPDLTPEAIVARWAEVVDESDLFVPTVTRPYRGM